MVSRITRLGYMRFSPIVSKSLYLGAAIALFSLPVHAQIYQAIVEEIIDGDAVFIQSNLAKVNDIAKFQEQIRTEESRTTLAFNNNVAGRLDTHSSLIVGQCIELQQGQLLVSGAANGCVLGFEADVRGTIYILEVNDREEASIQVLEGEVTLIPRNSEDTWEPIPLKAGQRLRLFPNRLLGPIEPIPAPEFAQILRGRLFIGFRRPLPGEHKLQAICQKLFPDFPCPEVGDRSSLSSQHLTTAKILKYNEDRENE
jgi:hypothetical protein